MGILNCLLCPVRCTGPSVVQLDHITLKQCQRKWWLMMQNMMQRWYERAMHKRACEGFVLSVIFVSWLRNEQREEIKLTSIMHLPEKCFVVLLFPLLLQMRAMCYLLCICVCVHAQHGMLWPLTPKCLDACIYSMSTTVHACLCECVLNVSLSVYLCVCVLPSPALSLPSLLWECVWYTEL